MFLEQRTIEIEVSWYFKLAIWTKSQFCGVPMLGDAYPLHLAKGGHDLLEDCLSF